MKTIYVVRGLGHWDNDVWASSDFEVTMLYQVGVTKQWKSEAPDREMMCYQGFRRVTGLALRPGEYIEINVQKV